MGTFSAAEGLRKCSQCSVGQFQANPGKTECQVCTKVYSDDRLTNNAEFTACIVNDALETDSITDMMFEQGGALSLTFMVAAGFVAMGVFMGYMREQEPDRLASFSRFEVLYNSFMSGFSFGADLFLIMAVLPDAPELGYVMALSRSIHFVGGAFLVWAIFGPEGGVRRLECVVPGITTMRNLIDDQFAHENVYLLESIALLSFCDISMLMFMPWKKSRFYVVSEGYPSFAIMKICMTIKTVQSFISVSCEITYLSLSAGGDTSDQAKALFYMNIVFGVVIVIMDLLMLCMRGGLLANVERNEELAAQSDEEKRKKKEGGSSSGSDVLEMRDVYAKAENGDMSEYGHEEGVIATANPMHSRSVELEVATLRQAMDAKDQELLRHQSSLKKKEKEIKRLRATMKGGVEGAVEGVTADSGGDGDGDGEANTRDSMASISLGSICVPPSSSARVLRSVKSKSSKSSSSSSKSFSQSSKSSKSSKKDKADVFLSAEAASVSEEAAL
jgi:hypothetical protein